MSQKKSFYITTTLPYVNAEPHIGTAMEFVQADIITRYKKTEGFDVFFNTGTDEHGQKIYHAALNANKDPQEYTDELAEKFKNLKTLLGLSDDLYFIRTTENRHKKAAQEFWKLCEKADDIYKKDYKVRYCVGCELEKTDSELVDDKCPIHPDKEIEIIEEENYFFRFSKYSEKLLELYDNQKDFVVPDFRLNEIRSLISQGLEDFSISRLKKKMPWGVEVPNDPEHVMYVWFDALVSYISTLGWPEDKSNFKKFWGDGNPTQFAGKDQVRQQAAMWQAMLMSAGLSNTNQIVIHGFLNISGQKMSKSLGNVISPQNMVDRYGIEATRALLAGVNQFEDTDVNIGVEGEGFDLAYETNLVNGLGNQVARIMTLAEANLDQPVDIKPTQYPEVSEALDKFSIQAALNHIFHVRIKVLDEKIQREKPWETKDKQGITSIVIDLAGVAYNLSSFMPETSNKILQAIKENKKPENLFPRLDA